MALLLLNLPTAILSSHVGATERSRMKNKEIASSFKGRALSVPPPLIRKENPAFAVYAKADETITKPKNGEVLTVEEDLPQLQARIGRGSFPPGFAFGAATSAYQIEGAASLEGRGQSIWDTFTHNFPGKIRDGKNGDVAADSYHRYKEDVRLLNELGMDAYRFSISWSRILPKGRGKVNEEGVQYYNNLINELKDNKIEPYVTLFHWDLPQALEDEYGGFLNGDRIVEDFKNYVDVCFDKFGDRVKKWITLNEALIFTTAGYGLGWHAPGHCTPDLEIKGLGKLNCPVGGDSLREPYIVAHNLLRAHAEAVHVYREKYKAKQNGEIGMTVVSHWFEPIDDSTLSKDAQERAIQFSLGWFMDPLKSGDYPLVMRALVGNRLPFFTPDQSAKLKDSYDFIGLNYYTARYARHRHLTEDFKPQSYKDDALVDELKEDNNGVPIERAELDSWINVYPRGLREMLLYIKRRYDNPPIYITENGVMEKDNKDLSLDAALNDTHRTEYLALHLHELREARRRGVDIKGYFTWSLLDNFEWSDGYSSRLGLHYIDYYETHKLLHKDHEKESDHSPPHLRRIPKQSVVWFKRFLGKK